MHAAKKSHVRSDISFIKGVWEVIIFIGDQTEHKSFPTEAEARHYADARIEHLRWKLPGTKPDGAAS